MCKSNGVQQQKRCAKVKLEPARYQYALLDRKLNKVCSQIEAIDRKMDAEKVRFGRVEKAKNNPFRYNLKMKMVTLQQVRNMMTEYASRQASEMLKLRATFTEEGVQKNKEN